MNTEAKPSLNPFEFRAGIYCVCNGNCNGRCVSTVPPEAGNVIFPEDFKDPPLTRRELIVCFVLGALYVTSCVYFIADKFLTN